MTAIRSAASALLLLAATSAAAGVNTLYSTQLAWTIDDELSRDGGPALYAGEGFDLRSVSPIASTAHLWIQYEDLDFESQDPVRRDQPGDRLDIGVGFSAAGGQPGLYGRIKRVDLQLARQYDGDGFGFDLGLQMPLGELFDFDVRAGYLILDDADGLELDGSVRWWVERTFGVFAGFRFLSIEPDAATTLESSAWRAGIILSN